ncbi:hypothetical protein ABK040_005667 [Willaertia magna]
MNKFLRFNTIFAGKQATKFIPKRGLEEFIDKTVLEGKPLETAGRAWGLKELRKKSMSDLQKLWLVLMKERNMLLTCRLLAKTMGGRINHPERLTKVRKSMARIKETIAEREREAKKLARIEFEKRLAQEYYTYPPVNPLGLLNNTTSESSTTTTQ